MAAAAAVKPTPSISYEEAFQWADNFYKQRIQKIIDLTPQIGTYGAQLGVASDRVRDELLLKNEATNINDQALKQYKTALTIKFLAEHMLTALQATKTYCTYPAWTESDCNRYKGENKNPEELTKENNRAAERITVLSSQERELKTQVHAIDKALEVFRNTLDQSIMRETTGNYAFQRAGRSIYSSLISYSYLDGRMATHNETPATAFDPEQVKKKIVAEYPIPFLPAATPPAVAIAGTSEEQKSSQAQPAADPDERKEEAPSLSSSQLTNPDDRRRVLASLQRPPAPSPEAVPVAKESEVERALYELLSAGTPSALEVEKPTTSKKEEAPRKRDEEFPPLSSKQRLDAAAVSAVQAPKPQSSGTQARKPNGQVVKKVT